MNTFNRAVLVTLCVLLIVAAVWVIVLTWTIPNRSINWLQDAANWLDDNDGDLEKALLTTISASIGLIATIVVLIELIPRRGPDVRVTDLSRGDATLSTAAIGQRIEEAVCQVPNVAEVRATVKARKKGVLVGLDLQVDPDANLATVTDEACQVAEDVLTNRVHVSLLRPPTARLHYRELRLHGRGNNASRRTQRDGPPVAPPLEPVATPVAVGAAAGSGMAMLPPEPPELPESLMHDGETLDDGATDNGADEEKTT
ncbi:MAG TPA: alkaline shock response membrane anchor protein AmaP [Dehalococcoidia bacterium]|jgi:hypothetical protein|nr:alkaline shock response membrane anchor protein AmaP [Dehalococcoidia bacterium]